MVLQYNKSISGPEPEPHHAPRDRRKIEEKAERFRIASDRPMTREETERLQSLAEFGKEHRHSDSEDSDNDGTEKPTLAERRAKHGTRQHQLQTWLEWNHIQDFGPRLAEYGVEGIRDLQFFNHFETEMLERDLEIAKVRKVRAWSRVCTQ